jgi:hypothetical protein
MKIEEFKKPKRVSTLPMVPLSLTAKQKQCDVEVTLRERGQKFDSLRRFHIMNCAGEKIIEMIDWYGKPQETAEPVSTPT